MRNTAKSQGTVYLLHFEKPLSHARHYIGFANGEGLEARIASHRAGTGAKIMAAVVEAGIDFEVVKTWTRDPKTGGPASRLTERDLKRQRNATRMCPICAPAKHEREMRLRAERAAGRPRLGVPWALSPEERYERQVAAYERGDVADPPEDYPADLPEFEDIPY